MFLRDGQQVFRLMLYFCGPDIWDFPHQSMELGLNAGQIGKTESTDVA